VRRERQQHHGVGDRQSAPRPGARIIAAGAEHPRAAGDDSEEQRDAGNDHRQRHHPPGKELPRRQREQIERQRPAEDWIDDARRRPRQRVAPRVPPQRERGPLRHHPGACGKGDQQRGDDRDQPQHRFDRQLDRLSVDQNRKAGQLAEARRLQRHERSVQDDERRERERAEDGRLQVQCFPEDGAVAERIEPQRVDVVGERRAAAEQQDARDDQEKDEAAPPGATVRRPIDGLRHLPVELQS